MAIIDARERMNSFGKIVPGDDTFVGKMVYAWVPNRRFDDRKDGLREVCGVGGSAYLVKDHTQRFAFMTETNHCLDKIITKRRVQPGRAEDNRFGTSGKKQFFSFVLSTTINGIGCSWIGLAIRYAGFAGKDIIRRYMYNAEALAAQYRECFGVDFMGSHFIFFRFVHIGIGGTIDDKVDGIGGHEDRNGLSVGNIEFLYVGKEVVVLGMLRREYAHFVSQLSVAACNQDVHIRMGCPSLSVKDVSYLCR